MLSCNFFNACMSLTMERVTTSLGTWVVASRAENGLGPGG